MKAEDIDRAFDLLYELQNLFFVEGLNINDIHLLFERLSNYGVIREQATLGKSQSKIKEKVMFQSENSRSFGTSVLPNILFEDGERRRLLLGGYADREVIRNTLSRLNERGNYWPETIHVDKK